MDEIGKGWMQVSFQTPYNLLEINPTRDWITNLLRQNPDLTGWPFFVDLWRSDNIKHRPSISNGVWEAEIISTEGNIFNHIDHWRIDAKKGLFYAARGLEDDTIPTSPNKGNTLDFVLAILRTAEILAISVKFINYLVDDSSDTSLTFPLNIEWKGLQNRVLASWVNPERRLHEEYRTNTDIVSVNTRVPVTTSQDQIIKLTQDIVGKLFLKFDGWECPLKVTEDLVGKLLSRRL